MVIPFTALMVATLLGADALPEPPPKSESTTVLTLAQALSSADDRLPQLQEAIANTAAANARVVETRGPLLPQLSGSAALVATDFFGGGTGATVSGGSVISGSGLHTTLGLTASQLLWDFGTAWDRYKAFRASAVQLKFTEAETRVQAHQVVRSAFYNARALRGLAGVARDTLENEKKHLLQTEGMVRVGTQPEIAVAQERTTYANDVFQVYQSEGNAKTGKALLNQAIGVEGSLDYEVEQLDAPPVEGEDTAIDGLMPRALKARPAYLAIENQVDAQRLMVRSYKGSLWPVLSLQGSLNASGTNTHNFAGNVSGEALLSWTLFNGLTNVGNIEEQEALLAADQAQADQLRQQIRVDLEQARIAVVVAKSGLTAAHAATLNAREQLRLAEGRFSTGVGNIIELGDSQVAYTNAQVQEIQAQYTLNNARATLLAKLGEA